MIVKYLGFNLSQKDMAARFKTTSNGTGAGAYLGDKMTEAVKNKFTFRWVWHTYSNVNGIKNHIITAIDYGNPVMVNTVESPGDVYLKGHNVGYTILHYGVVRGYSNSGNNVIYLDPGYGRFSGFVKEQFPTAKDISYAAGGRGYVW